MKSHCSLYRPLNSERREIRLLTLVAGNHDDPLRCQLTTASLIAEPGYNALSYVWGQPASSTSSESTIVLDGHHVPVTANLHSALRHLRQPVWSHSVCLWVDAVCINQNDVDERNQQVAMMRDIYASAAQVTIWLGEEDEDSNVAFDAIPLVADEKSWFWQHENDDKEGHRWEIRRHCGNFFFSLASCRPWFSRVWILQELAMPKSDPAVVCGWKRAPWSTFVVAWQVIAKSRSAGLVSMQKELVSPNGDCQLLNMTKLDLLNGLRQTAQLKTGESLRKLLLISRTSAATDPRDRIYGVLGLLEQDALDPDQSAVISVDYRQSCAEVYADAMTHIFSRGDGPYLLSGAFLSGGSVAAPHISTLPASTSQPELPSWVPDFSGQTFDTARQSSGISFLPPATMSVSGAGQGAKNGRVLEDGRTLQVEGLVVDVIDEVIPLGSSLENIIERLPHLEWVTAEARKRFCMFDAAIAHHMQRFKGSEPLWRVLISNNHRKSGYEPAPASYEATYLSYLSAASTNDKISKHVDDSQKPEYEVSLRSCVNRKCFFTTKSGFVGTCIPSGRDGDIIAIVFGSPAPFVLRPIPPADEEPSYYSLIGTCYVGGIMNGEMVDELYCEDLMDSTTFLIR